MKKFNDLHADVADEIFSYLDTESLKNAMEVCKKWNRIIGGNSSTMKKFKFVVPNNWTKYTDEIKAMSRLVTTVQFRRMRLDGSNICEVLKKFDFQIKSLIIDNVNIERRIFSELIGMFQLDELVINGTRFETKEKQSDASVGKDVSSKTINDDQELRKVMKMITIDNPDEQMFDMLAGLRFRSSKLALKISNKSTYSAEGFKPAFENFIMQQHRLKDVVIKLPASSSILGVLVDRLRVTRLEKIAIYLEDCGSEYPSYDGLAELIISQPSLKEVEICSDMISKNAIKALYQTRGLQKLKLMIDSYPESFVLPSPCEPHANLKTLIITYADPNDLDVLLTMFANVETLAVNKEADEGDSVVVATLASKHLKSLKYFSVPCMTDDFLSMSVSIPSLQKFQISCLDSVKGLQSFMSHNPSLQELEILRIFDGNFKFELLRHSASLRKVTIGFGFGSKPCLVSDIALRVLKASCPNLNEIEIYSCRSFIIYKKTFDNSPIKITTDIKKSLAAAFDPSIMASLDFMSIFNDKEEKPRVNVFERFSRSSFHRGEEDTKFIHWNDVYDSDSD